MEFKKSRSDIFKSISRENRYRIESPSGRPTDTQIFLRLENGHDVLMPDITKVTWSVDADGPSRAIIEVVGVKIGTKPATGC